MLLSSARASPASAPVVFKKVDDERKSVVFIAKSRLVAFSSFFFVFVVFVFFCVVNVVVVIWVLLFKESAL